MAFEMRPEVSDWRMNLRLSDYLRLPRLKKSIFSVLLDLMVFILGCFWVSGSRIWPLNCVSSLNLFLTFYQIQSEQTTHLTQTWENGIVHHIHCYGNVPYHYLLIFRDILRHCSARVGLCGRSKAKSFGFIYIVLIQLNMRFINNNCLSLHFILFLGNLFSSYTVFQQLDTSWTGSGTRALRFSNAFLCY